ncbi:hypothetical protein ABZ498_32155 [Streptomyces lavendulocolor]|uniref:hypothetical protein n=1 Tax=Streptomyces lavendulocolor TaxID=67316 RepID=UPI003407819F
MDTISSVAGRIGRRTALVLAGGVAVLVATVAIATVAVAGGGPDTPAPSAPAASPSASSSSGNEAPNTGPGDDASGCCGEGMSEGGWDDDGAMGKGGMDYGAEMRRGGMDDRMGMGDG